MTVDEFLSWDAGDDSVRLWETLMESRSQWRRVRRTMARCRGKSAG